MFKSIIFFAGIPEVMRRFLVKDEWNVS